MTQPTNKTALFAAVSELLDNRMVTDIHPEDRTMLEEAIEAAAGLAIEVSAVRGFGPHHGDPVIETCNDAETMAEGYAIYIRNPLAFHIMDFGTESTFEDRRATLMEAKDAAFTYAGALAEHLRCEVWSYVNRHNDPETGAAFVPWVISQAELLTGQGQVTTFLQPDGCWIANRDTARPFLSEAAALEALPKAMPKFADPEAFSVVRQSEQPPAAVAVHDLVEAAACLWEAALEMMNFRPTSQAGAILCAGKEREGAASLRLRVIGWAADCHNDWLAAGGYDLGEPFDWEFAPEWLAKRVVREG